MAQQDWICVGRSMMFSSTRDTRGAGLLRMCVLYQQHPTTDTTNPSLRLMISSTPGDEVRVFVANVCMILQLTLQLQR
jgi:hypothetical protein